MGKKSVNKHILWFAALTLVVSALIVLLLALVADQGPAYYAIVIVMLAVAYVLLESTHLGVTEEDVFEDPLIGREVVVTQDFEQIDDGFEGRVLLNDAPWNARSSENKYKSGEFARVKSRNGQMLELN